MRQRTTFTLASLMLASGYVAQAQELSPLEIVRQIAGIGIEGVDLLLVRRIDPRVQLHADFGEAALDRFPDHFDRAFVHHDRPVDQVERHHAEPFAKCLELADLGDVRQAVIVLGKGTAPFEFFFGVDGQQDALAEVRPEPGFRIAARRLQHGNR